MVFVNAEKKGERRHVLLLCLMIVCMCQIVSGAANMLDLEKDMDGNQRLSWGWESRVRWALGKTHWQVEDQHLTMSKDQMIRTYSLIQSFMHQFEKLLWSICWDVLDARNQWRTMDPTSWSLWSNVDKTTFSVEGYTSEVNKKHYGGYRVCVV